jgi:hypothetical protein
MSSPIPAGRAWSAANASSGSTYETTGPVTTELPTGKFGDITKFGGRADAVTALVRSVLRRPTAVETAQTVVRKMPPRRVMPDIRELVKHKAKSQGTYAKLSTAMLTADDFKALRPKIAHILKLAEEGGGGGGNPVMEAMKIRHTEEKHEQDMRHSEEMHSVKMEEKQLSLQQKQEAMAMKQQEQGMEMPPEPPPPPPDPQQAQSMIEAAYQNHLNSDPAVMGPIKEGALSSAYFS